MVEQGPSTTMFYTSFFNDLWALANPLLEIAQGAVFGLEGVLAENVLYAMAGLESWHKPTRLSLPSRSILPR